MPDKPSTAKTGTAETTARLAAEWTAHQQGGPLPTGGRVWGMPDLPDGDQWVTVAGACAITGLAGYTVRSYTTSRAGTMPRGNPFPSAHRTVAGVMFRLSEVTAWCRRRDEINAAR